MQVQHVVVIPWAARALTPASSLCRFSDFSAFIFARVFDGKVALLAVSSGGLGGHSV